MPGLLTRSKSLRFLKGSRKEQEHEYSMPPPNAPQTDLDRYTSATQIPRPESKLETQDLMVRPSTSGGTEDRATMFYTKKTNTSTSADSQDQVQAFIPPTNSTTVLYTAEVTEEQGIIGIALGSPTVGSHWNTTPQASCLELDSHGKDTQMATLHSNGSVASRQEPAKAKISRWKSLFRKAAPPPQEKPAFYQLAQTVTAGPRADSPQDKHSLESPVTLKQEKGTSRTASPLTYKPDIRASRKAGEDDFIAPRSPPEPSMKRGRAVTLGVAAFNPQSTATIQRSNTTPNLPRNMPDKPPNVPQVVVSKSASNASVPASEGGLLDISIPDITMERYSVMFGNLLQSNSNRSSSLLARRNGNAEKLKPLNGLFVKGEHESPMDYKLQRRATSPTFPSPSPRLSLFPSTNPARAPSPHLTSANRATKALQRSRTAPAKSPLRQPLVPTTEEKPTKSDLATLRPTASPLQPVFTPTSVESFESDAESITILVGHSQSQPLKFHLDEREPEWEMYPKPKPLAISKRDNTASGATPLLIKAASTTNLARTASQRQPKVTKMSALSSHPSESSSPPPGASRADVVRRNEKRTESETRGDGATAPKAMVGVARSISVSRANSPRALVQTTLDVASPNTERLVARQVLTPTMVDVKNRRSHRVQLVDA
ncbi:uncharacterized protein K460DRAFT_370533 [Cucurbitaria berberidis CBS 394.84]|uniref:Uncharacterized protein n=1 Tax=Cucurbitaria berberidis CBS 394.84 TaxID=1168544 RepID=A0A9P4GBZ7_9PLEO|nr:uncharacterized protein K460DRAFT_370533 [Cucurbitaria berberidis CBS 394.84]KAF1842561.1 hypothetical protein K460DRAFT_370533 [Cucurbitaria berberidis CBS 394.84]